MKDAKLASAVRAEREQTLALRRKVEELEADARARSLAAKAAAEGETRGRRAAVELAELARQQKVCLAGFLPCDSGYPEDRCCKISFTVSC